MSMGTGRSILCCVHGDRSICGLATDLHVYGDGSILFHPWGQVDLLGRILGGRVNWSILSTGQVDSNSILWGQVVRWVHFF